MCSRWPSRGPEPLLLTPNDVDALYDCLEAVERALASLGVRPILLAGSLLGAIRSQSILFCDDDVDIGVLDADYERVLAELPGAIAHTATYKRRPWPAADRIRPRGASGVWIDVFVLRLYASEGEMRAMLSRRANGTEQPPGYADGLLSQLRSAGGVFPLYHYDNRKAIELWPREFFGVGELLPLREYAFGHLRLCGPQRPVAHLRRAYGSSCFTHFKLASSHVAWSAQVRQRLDRLSKASAQHWDANGGSAAEARCPRQSAALALAGEAVALADGEYLPVQHSSRAKRVWSAHCRAKMLAFLKEADGCSETAAAAVECATCSAPAHPACGTPLPQPQQPDPQAWPPQPQQQSHSQQQQPLELEQLRAPAKPNWFGAALSAANKHSALLPDFSCAAIRAAMEPHLAKARAARAAAPAPRAHVRALLDTPRFRALACEQTVRFDIRAHGIRTAFARALGLGIGEDGGAGGGEEEDAAAGAALAALRTGHAKDAALLRLREARWRLPFQRAFLNLVLTVLLPALYPMPALPEAAAHQSASCPQSPADDTAPVAPAAGCAAEAGGTAARPCDCGFCGGAREGAACPRGCGSCGGCGEDDEGVAYIQAFPCVRLICPGQFSIGPHADAAYGHSLAAINCVIPLCGGGGSGALVAESAPGREDWHALPSEYGTLTTFHGAACLHFAGEQLGGAGVGARASLDFRLLPAAAWEAGDRTCAQSDMAGAGCRRAQARREPSGEGQRRCEDRYSGMSGYFVRARRVPAAGGERGPDGSACRCLWVLDEQDELPEPDERVGFPFGRHRAAPCKSVKKSTT